MRKRLRRKDGSLRGGRIDAPSRPSRPSRADWAEAFIEAYRKYRNIGKACSEVGTSHQRVNERKKSDPAFKAAMEACWDERVDMLEQAAINRATFGSPKVSFDRNGKVISTERVLETGLTIFMLRKNMRDKYDEKISDLREGSEELCAMIRQKLREMHASVVDE